MAYYFQSRLAAAAKAFGVDHRLDPQHAREWYREVAQKVRSVETRRVVDMNKDLHVTTPVVGKMYCYWYDPKWKKELPYYDRFPLIFPFDVTSKMFYGINLHYLPPVLRAKLMDALYSLMNNKKYDRSTRLKLSYAVLAGAKRYRYFEPCVKSYLWGHVRSKFVEVPVTEWDMALMLPMERFSKATKQRVWKDSVASVGG